MFDDNQKAAIKAIVVEALVEIAEREPKTLRENHDYVAHLRMSDRRRIERRRQLFDKVAGTLVVMTVLGVTSLVIAGALQWLRINL